jgi:hypothetical protein
MRKHKIWETNMGIWESYGKQILEYGKFMRNEYGNMGNLWETNMEIWVFYVK